jgi:haloacetate dehalogenase
VPAPGPPLPDLYPGFASRRIATAGAEIALRTGGSGPPLLLLHGYPQTHVCWHRIAPDLARSFTLVIPDLRGYGESSAPSTDAGHHAYSKRAMAEDCAEVMRGLGQERFLLVGHDRGGRVAYRLALDHPQAVIRLATLDIVPTYDAYLGWGPKDSAAKFHWPFLARPAPFPEQMIGRDPVHWLEYLCSQWSGTGDLTPFAPEAMRHYRHHFSKPSMIHATCEDYRAGATCDFAADEADRKAGRKIACPLLALWGPGRTGGFVSGPLEIWRRWCDDVRGAPIASGHFLAEENPEATLRALVPFLSEARPTT